MSTRMRWLAILTAAVLAACGDQGARGTAAPTAEPVAAATATAAVKSIPDLLEATGSVEPWVRVSPGTKILGRVAAVAAREGDRVARGDLLVRLEDRDLKAAVDQARAAVGRAEAGLENARSQDARMEALHARGSVTDKMREDAATAGQVAEAALSEARAALAGAEATLAYTVIRAPRDGVVVERRVEPGDMATPGAPLLTLEDLSRVKVQVQVPEAAVMGLAPGAPATVRVDALEADFPAKVDRVWPAGDPASRTFRVELVLDNVESRLRSGLFVRARFPRGSRPALLVPAAALWQRGGLTGAYVLDGEGVARLRWVEPGRAHGEEVEILSGLAAGEVVVVDPPPALADGVPVRAR